MKPSRTYTKNQHNVIFLNSNCLHIEYQLLSESFKENGDKIKSLM